MNFSSSSKLLIIIFKNILIKKFNKNIIIKDYDVNAKPPIPSDILKTL